MKSKIIKDIQLVEINSEIGAGTRGASLGPEAIKIASINYPSTYFSKKRILKVEDKNHLLFKNSKHLYAKHIKGIFKVLKNLSGILKEVFQNNYFPIVLAGDHSTAAGTIAGIKRAFPDKRLGTIWIDAHPDLHSPYTTPSGNVHGMPLAMALQEDNLIQKNNEVSAETIDYWNKIKNISKNSQTLDYQDIVFLGIRDINDAESYLISEHNIKSFTVTNIRQKGIDNIVKKINNYLDNCDLIYISFDVDSMDCSYISHGTGTPVPVGFSELEVTEILTKLLKNEKTCCFEITEVNPILDEKGNLMAETAFRILNKVTEVLKNVRLNK